MPEGVLAKFCLTAPPPLYVLIVIKINGSPELGRFTLFSLLLRHVQYEPVEYIYRGQDRQPTTFGELTLAEFVYGFISMIDNPRNLFDKELMLSV